MLMMGRRAVVLLLLAVALVAARPVGPAWATDTTEPDLSECVNALPGPNCGREPDDAGDRGGAAQLALFGVLLVAMGGIGFVIVRSTRRRTKAASSRVATPARAPGSQQG